MCMCILCRIRQTLMHMSLQLYFRCLYICMYTYIHVYTHIYICIYIYMYVFIFLFVVVLVIACAFTCKVICICPDIRVGINDVHVCIVVRQIAALVRMYV